MAVKQFNARITMKRDTASNWEQNNPVLLDGEIIIVDTASGEVRFKIGDGTKLYKQLPFQDEAVRALISAKEDEISLTANRAVISDSSGKLSVSAVTSTELSYLDGVSSNLQTQIDNKVPTTRKVNNKALSEDITLTASDVHALPDTTSIPTKTSELTNDSNFVTQSILNDGLNAKLDKADAGSDWNQNDATKPDYIKNRPFYTGAPMETVLVEESTVSFVNANGTIYMGQIQSNFQATVGETYKVSWDGTTYERTCVNLDEYLYIGNLSIPGVGSDTGEPFLIYVANGKGIEIYTLNTSASHTISISGLSIEVVKIDAKYLPDPFKPEGKSYLTFSSQNSFDLGVYSANKGWDGTLEYFASDRTWTTWDGASNLSAVYDYGEYVLYLRGTGNTTITKTGRQWVLIGTDIACIGNIETLLDYATVESGNHPTMAPNCYYRMFYDCTSLIRAPELPAIMVPYQCYSYMFQGCTGLTKAPELPAITLANECYVGMFENCTSLTQVPDLPATTLTTYCYHYMFAGCTSLTQAPSLLATTLGERCCEGMFSDCTSLIRASELPATTLATYCYNQMFLNCTALTQAPSLPATTLANSCYFNMFGGCTSLTQAPALPATTLAVDCYTDMFDGCTSLTQAPALSATTLVDGCYRSMFQGCTSLTQAPALPATTLASSCYNDMFFNCSALTKIPELPATTLGNSCYLNMFYGCTSLKLSSTKTGEYTQEYRIPSSGTGTADKTSLIGMFYSTGGTFTGDPSINTTYYLSTDNMIVRETEVATLNGYVASMIDVAAVPTTRKINGKALSADITLSATDVNALPSTTTIPSKTSQLTNDSGFITSSDIPQLSRASVSIANDNTSTIDIPITIVDPNYLTVYQNGLILTPTTHYTATTTAITLVGYTADAGDIFTFVGTAESGASLNSSASEVLFSDTTEDGAYSGCTTVQDALIHAAGFKSDVQSISVNGVEIPPVDGSVNISGVVKSISVNGTDVPIDQNGSASITGVVKSISVDGTNVNVDSSGAVAITGVVKSISVNGTNISIDSSGSASITGLVKTISVNGTNINVDAKGAVAITGLVKSLSLNGTSYTPNSSGVLSLTNIMKTNTDQTMSAKLIAQNNTDYTTAQLRNVIISTQDPSGGNNGDIWIKYTV